MKNIVFLKLSILFFALSFNHSHANEKGKTLNVDNETIKDTLKPNQKKFQSREKSKICTGFW